MPSANEIVYGQCLLQPSKGVLMKVHHRIRGQYTIEHGNTLWLHEGLYLDSFFFLFEMVFYMQNIFSGSTSGQLYIARFFQLYLKSVMSGLVITRVCCIYFPRGQISADQKIWNVYCLKFDIRLKKLKMSAWHIGKMIFLYCVCVCCTTVPAVHWFTRAQ
jgi:hypothetical protein